MARYIDANLLWKALDIAHLFDEGNPRHIAQQVVEEQPTTDVIPVVRCKNCVYANDYGDTCHFGEGRFVTPDHYCGYGEKRCDNE